ncbi:MULTISPECIES: PDR/VanB family oxidoreductase [unclassified Streptomyces]|uniref:PDR/VanB family oxidoreductase n=1 Tax=unclassified Streptomyces TaxID=2593676 RepID=UPI0022B7118C|nr:MULTISPECIES: PDR/VanB family oxidoreductase [unclassified Streptomyces]MCZ7417307.1 PDR/VanB family oxidoreductase [Streptomyces sp. WMMC897]MCZ7432866.1 PDR/VanB family oxidoreductase [Streptomyces sp. WMMC1477]
MSRHPIPPAQAPPSLFGRRRPDLFLRLLDAFADRYIDLATRKDRYGRRPRPDRPPLRLTVTSREAAADDVVALRLTAADGAPLPPWQPGAHLDLLLPSGRRRQYSLCGDPAERYAYRIAVRRIPDGDGGSREVHDTLTAGTRVTVTGPRNAFPFAADPAVLLLAGGIGITPILPMAREAARRGLDWRLVHCGRTRASLPFRTELAALAERHPGRVELLTDDEDGVPDAAGLLGRAPAGAAVYCCGPGPMLDAVRAAFEPAPATALHVERFAAAPIVDGKPFSLRLRHSGTVLPVPADRSALDVLRENDPGTPYSCRQGFCGVCRLRVVSGTVDHRDRKLGPAERADGDMLVCVSRAPEGECLELDL